MNVIALVSLETVHIYIDIVTKIMTIDVDVSSFETLGAATEKARCQDLHFFLGTESCCEVEFSTTDTSGRTVTGHARTTPSDQDCLLFS